ncbi:hypothetical protein CMQ_6378 [Grosmannia clavigera kw1407]|uniref:Flavin-nucleotide-binding protein n=1 Tax=Grosmannia clavigera (strain kw1407 / UAMH 11150) TaxID=655863 RepID=F0XLD7_GROCL|nr:uncharacterized protein CMQ_6378 [Grosmannia clavigera kw1407]EFX01436.1 hypothetical protein CMQ_6378 [Grosmannia clavigera kw1407]
MPRFELEYPKEPYSTVHRKSSRATYALKTIHGIVNGSQLVHVSFQAPDAPFPAILPMIGQMGSFERPSADVADVLDLYLHGYVSSRLMNISRGAESSGSSPGLPIAVAASQVDGLVLALTPNAHSYNYRSAVLFGHATVVTDASEKLYAMRLITDGIVTGRWDGSRVPPNAAEMQSTSVLRVRIAGGSAKIRTGGPHDDRCDLGDEAVLDRVWTGVLPVYQTIGAPVAGPYNRVAQVPDHVTAFRDEFNTDAAELALEALKEPGKEKE